MLVRVSIGSSIWNARKSSSPIVLWYFEIRFFFSLFVKQNIFSCPEYDQSILMTLYSKLHNHFMYYNHHFFFSF